jgi:uncharacterized cupin superfamily protein
MGPVDWDDAPDRCFARDPLRGRFADLGELAGSVEVGLGRWRPEPGCQTTPAHIEGGEEEISFIAGGSGWSWIDGSTFAVSAGDCLVHLVDEGPHTLVAGDDGLDVLAFGERASRGAHTWLPRAGVLRIQDTWVVTPGGDHPYLREAAVGRVPLGEPAPRPERIVALGDVRPVDREHGATRVTFRDLGRAAGSVRTGIVHITIAPGRESMPPHVHSAEEELFVVLDGSGECLLGDERFAVDRGSVIARPAGTRVAHSFVAGVDGLTMLAYGQRVPHDVCWYPRSQKVSFRAFPLRFRVADALDYWDGEPE